MLLALFLRQEKADSERLSIFNTGQGYKAQSGRDGGGLHLLSNIKKIIINVCPGVHASGGSRHWSPPFSFNSSWIFLPAQ